MNWKRLMKHYCLEEFYNNLNMEDIADVDYMHAKRVCKNFKLKINVFENFGKMCSKIYHLDPAKFLSAPGLA